MYGGRPTRSAFRILRKAERAEPRMTLDYEESAAALAAPSASGSNFRIDFAVLQARGWSSHPEECAPKIAALASLANLEAPDPVARVTYTSHGNLLVIAGDATARAVAVAEVLAASMPVTLLAAQPVAAPGNVASWCGRIEALSGYLGEFIAVIDSLRTASSGGASPSPTEARFDLVLDFSTQPLLSGRQPPQGYFRAPEEPTRLEEMVEELRDCVGEFEKPRFFAYRESICAHSRSEIVGCDACIEVCSTRAISSDGDHVKVDPHLCMGCGACSTVCPSGAMSYQFPRVADRGAQLKQLLSAYRQAGGREACVLYHDGSRARALLAEAAACGEGLPARALPLEAWHVASIGLDILLPAVAFGASQVAIVATDEVDAEYREALRAQLAIAQDIVSGMGYEGRHFHLVEACDASSLQRAFAALEPAAPVPVPATFLLSNDKRTAIEFAVEHLLKHSPGKPERIALAAGAPYGEVLVDRDKCTMCMSCVGACPESALMDGVDQPLLKFVERNCVQCGLCERTCPENAISLSPRLLLTPAVREARVLNETQPFHCVSCGKPFGTKQMVEAMLGRLTNHSMFSQPGALRRLQMCGDCRVVDMMAARNEVSVLTLGDQA